MQSARCEARHAKLAAERERCGLGRNDACLLSGNLGDPRKGGQKRGDGQSVKAM